MTKPVTTALRALRKMRAVKIKALTRVNLEIKNWKPGTSMLALIKQQHKLTASIVSLSGAITRLKEK